MLPLLRILKKRYIVILSTDIFCPGKRLPGYNSISRHVDDTPKSSNNEDNEKPVEIKQPSLLVQHFQGMGALPTGRPLRFPAIFPSPESNRGALSRTLFKTLNQQ